MTKLDKGYFHYNANYKSDLAFIHCGIKQNLPDELCGPAARNMYLLHYVIDGKGLYFAGEVIDVDAYTGGFNLQIAWSTAYAAGKSAAESLW